MGAYLSLSGNGREMGWGGGRRLFEAGRLYSNKYGTQITVTLLPCSMKILRVLIFANFAD